MELIQSAAQAGEKKRFALTNDQKHIRATYGHSINMEIHMSEASPPEILYHGTQEKSLASIQNEGITSRGRQYVHLSISEQEANAVASRKAQPVILEVKAGKMSRSGFNFFQTDESFWLTNEVPRKFIRLQKFVSS